MQVRSVSFDTSFLLKNNRLIDKIIKNLSQDVIPCFVTSTVVSELEQLKVWGRISSEEYHRAYRRIKNANGTVIDFKNQLLSSAFGKECIDSMEKHHGVKEKDIVNDCNILVAVLKKGVDIFLSEDFHFTSKITKEVINEVKNVACSEYHQMCGTHLYNIDHLTFLKAYYNGNIDLDIIKNSLKSIRKKGKIYGKNQDIDP